MHVGGTILCRDSCPDAGTYAATVVMSQYYTHLHLGRLSEMFRNANCVFYLHFFHCMCCTLQARHEWASLRRGTLLLMRSSAMTTDSHTLDRLQMHTGKRAFDSITSCVCLMCKGCCQVVTRLRCALLPSWRCCLACVCAALLACQPAKQAPCTCLPVLMPYCLRQQRGATLFAASGCIYSVDFMAQAYWAPQSRTSRCTMFSSTMISSTMFSSTMFSSTMFSSTMFSSYKCRLHCVVGACVAAVSAQAPCCTSPSVVRRRTAAQRLHVRLFELRKPWQRT